MRYPLPTIMILLLLVTSRYGTDENPVSGSRQPHYRVSISMPVKQMGPPGKRFTVTFLISGSGVFMSAHVEITSDRPNLLSNTLTLKGKVIGSNITFYWLNKLKSKEIETKVNNVTFNFSGNFSTHPKYEENMNVRLDGSIQVDAISEERRGPCRITVVFHTESLNASNSFEDSSTYEVLDFWQANPWAGPAVGPMLVAVVGALVTYLLSRGKRVPTE